MKRALLTFILAVCALQAHAQTSPTDALLSSLRAKGYAIVSQERTWLGRERVVAQNGEHQRELVFNPGTGEIFRDYSMVLRKGSQTEKPEPAIRMGTTAPVADPAGSTIDLSVTATSSSVDVRIGDPIVTNDGTVAP